MPFFEKKANEVFRVERQDEFRIKGTAGSISCGDGLIHFAYAHFAYLVERGEAKFYFALIQNKVKLMNFVSIKVLNSSSRFSMEVH